ncbi:MAG: hypothetical protein PQJ59_02070 [Spirochaetales bacterium]|nr:hypothetical protein [Spirochaetales bacterium]
MKNKLLTLLLLFPITLLAGKEKIAEDTKLGLLLYFHTDQDAEIKDYYSAGGTIKIETKPTDNLEFQFEIDINNSEVELDELWARYDFKDPKVKFGFFDNTILMEDSYNRRESLFANSNYFQDRLEEMGWRSSNSAGIRLDGDEDRNNIGSNWSAEAFYITDSSEPMFTAAFSYPWAEKDSFAGASITYYPQFCSDFLDDDTAASLTSPSQEGFIEDQYMMGNLYFGDNTEKRKWVYKVEAGMGNNLTSPVSYTHYPDDGSCSWFVGADSWMGYVISFRELQWTPGLNTAVFIHDLSDPEANTTIIKTGNRLRWLKDFYLHLDAGVEINNYFDGSDKEVETDPEVLCAVRLQYQY